MPMTTWLGEQDHLELTSSKTINKLLAELNAEGCGQWRIQERILFAGAMWWKRRVSRFCLYGHVSGSEWQMINIGSSLMAWGSESEMANWIGGMLCGIDCERKKSRK